MVDRRLLAVSGLILVMSGCGTVLPQPTPSPTNVESSSTSTPIAEASPSGWSEPAAYTFILSSQCGERAMLGPFRVNVEDGTTIAFEPIDEQARLFQGPPGIMPTLAGLIARAPDARARGADRVDVISDPADGHPVSVTIDMDAAAIDDEECYEISDYVPTPPTTP
jgi:uncharacterized protein YceK